MAEEKKEPQIPQLSPARFKGGEYVRSVWIAIAEQEHTREHFKDRNYWSHASQKLKPYDHIEVVRDDGTLYAEYLVLEVGRGWANVHELAYHSLTSKDVAQTQVANIQGYEIKWNGPHNKWIVVREVDQAKIHEQCATREEATLWLTEHLKAQ